MPNVMLIKTYVNLIIYEMFGFKQACSFSNKAFYSYSHKKWSLLGTIHWL